MASQPSRLQASDCYFHITSRGTDQWTIFLDDQDRTRFLLLVGRICERYAVEVVSYCLMGNHFHLLLYCRDPTLSQAMRDLKSRYATYFNKRHGRSGPLFGGPFWSEPVVDDAYLYTVVRYIDRNPLDLDPRIDLAAYPWSSLGIYLGLRPCPHWMRTQIVTALFGSEYREIVERPMGTDKIQNAVQPIVSPPGAITIEAARGCSLSMIRQEVAAAADCEVSSVRTRTQNGLIGVAVLIALEVGGFTAAEICDPFGFGSSAAVHMAARRARVRLCTDEHLATVFGTVQQRLPAAA